LGHAVGSAGAFVVSVSGLMPAGSLADRRDALAELVSLAFRLDYSVDADARRAADLIIALYLPVTGTEGSC
jgi:hypothetical protein